MNYNWKNLLKAQYDRITINADNSATTRWIEFDGNKPVFKRSVTNKGE